ncbi:hypothetical protein [Maribacter polysaccharolyticus]|uniref:hypothetical protein n=1 Tax=Maribacter polysaccharolyticus TaxID=3020831 RepID=UPI00237FD536|nr:hypothetical protein [Maribacter polysaccharolyticus]MDE3744069.1 hypothetical protein [Maribacter polysaccharolyticus]
MKDQKAILIKCIKNDVPAFVIAGHDQFAVPTLKAYFETAKENGADDQFLKDMTLVVQEMIDFQEQEPEKVHIPKLKEFEIEQQHQEK